MQKHDFTEEPVVATETRIFAADEASRETVRPVAKSWWNFGVVSIFAVPLLIVGVLLSHTRSMADILTEDEQLKTRVDEAKELGFSFDPKAFEQPAVAPERNAYLLLEKLFPNELTQLSPAIKEVMAGDPYAATELSPELKELIRRAYEVSAAERFSNPNIANTNNSIGVYSSARTATKALLYDATFKAKNGDIQGAIGGLKACRNLTSILKDDPTAIGLVVSAGNESLANRIAEVIASRCNADPKVLDELLKIQAEPLPLQDPAQAIRYDFYSRYRLIVGPQALPGEMPRSLIKQGELAVAIKIMIEQIKLLGEVKDPAELAEKLREKRIAANLKLSSYNLATMTPQLEQVYFSKERSTAYRALSIWKLEIERSYKGNYPATLPSRVDPGLGGKLIYQKTKDGFIVYSTGGDRKDDGGPLARSKTERPVDDIGWSYPPKQSEKGR